MRIIGVFLLTILLSFSFVVAANSLELPKSDLNLNAESAILMDTSTGTVLYEQNSDIPLAPASVTKVMTLLIVMEAVDNGMISLTDTVTASETAASMGGSQIFLKAGEQMTVEDMIKSVVIASANDCAVALAEHICGSEDAFVSKMNERAAELGLLNTHFENTNGLDDTTVNHVMSAKDIAIISRELLTHPTILKYSNIWMDSVRNGAFGLTNTNRLVRFYKGATGLKTGSTSKAKFCISATAERDGLHLIAVIMASPTRDIRNNAAKSLLDYGFANFGLFVSEAADCGSVNIIGGTEKSCPLLSQPFSIIVPKNKVASIKSASVYDESVAAPVIKGQCIGKTEFTLDGELIGSSDILAADTVERIGFGDIFTRILQNFLP